MENTSKHKPVRTIPPTHPHQRVDLLFILCLLKTKVFRVFDLSQYDGELRPPGPRAYVANAIHGPHTPTVIPAAFHRDTGSLVHQALITPRRSLPVIVAGMSLHDHVITRDATWVVYWPPCQSLRSFAGNTQAIGRHSR